MNAHCAGSFVVLGVGLQSFRVKIREHWIDFIVGDSQRAWAFLKCIRR